MWRSRAAELIRRLARDEGGNALLLMAAALLPILGLIGSGLDLSRAYLVKSKLQTACDAGSLAARRYMAAGTLDSGAIAEGQKFFGFNFPDGTMGSAPVNLTIAPNPTDVSTVDMKAKTTVPTSIMGLFGVGSLPVGVECSADQDYVNNDIMLVLDVTGSMNDRPSGAPSGTKLERTRVAALALYNALKDARGVRTRYGFMPYSQIVNPGASLRPEWLREPGNYWQRPSTTWLQVPVSHNALWYSTQWTGCVEERSTLSQGTGAAIRISGDVSKEDIDTVGTATHLQWTPYDPDATQGLDTVNGVFCPARARKLQPYDTLADFQTAVNDALSRAMGQTNHDLGIMWGMRFLSSTGMFSSENPEVFRGVPVAKHIIFLTDGDMTAGNSTQVYHGTGVPGRGVRMIGSGSLESRHQTRFQNACNRARQMGATIWVIALDTPAGAAESTLR